MSLYCSPPELPNLKAEVEEKGKNSELGADFLSLDPMNDEDEDLEDRGQKALSEDFLHLDM